MFLFELAIITKLFIFYHDTNLYLILFIFYPVYIIIFCILLYFIQITWNKFIKITGLRLLKYKQRYKHYLDILIF